MGKSVNFFWVLVLLVGAYGCAGPSLSVGNEDSQLNNQFSQDEDDGNSGSGSTGGDSGGDTGSDTGQDSGGDSGDDGEDDPSICNPLDDMGDDMGAMETNGLIAQLAHLPTGETADGVNDLWTLDIDGYYVPSDQVIEVSTPVFSQNLNVPTRIFNTGFLPNDDQAQAVVNDQGDLLVENFGLHFESVLIQGNAEPGLYEFAVLSDDGVIMTLTDAYSAGDSLILNNDGNHPTRMGCQTDPRAVRIESDTELKFDLSYYQGPAQHIALVMLWRKIEAENGAGADEQCGDGGNKHFFDPNNNSEPQQAYLDLLAKGWKPIPSTSFMLPDELQNPCADM